MENPQNQDALIIGNCLACQGLVRVPAKAVANAKVRCPHCSQSFLLSQILDQAVPELQMVEEPTNYSDLKVDENGASKDDEGRFVVPSQLRRNKKRRSRKSGDNGSSGRSKSSGSKRASGQSNPEGYERVEKLKQAVAEPRVDSNEEFGDRDDTVEFSSEESIVDRPTIDADREIESTSSSRSSRSRSQERAQRGSREESRNRKRPKRKRSSYEKSSSTGAEILKVVIGGMLAIPIAYLIVLWLFKLDPLKFAPTLVDRAPFLVPAEFRPVEDEDVKATDASVDDVTDDNELITDDNGLAKPKLDPDKIGIK